MKVNLKQRGKDKPKLLSSVPLDVRDIAVRLETEGVTDTVAVAKHQFPDTWTMAVASFAATQVVPSSEPPLHRFSPGWAEYLKGISFALPLIFSLTAMLLLKFSIWGGPLPGDVATAVGLGIVSSFVASGGFVQALARRGLFYDGTEQFRMCLKSTWQWVRRGVLSLLALALCGLGANSYFDWLPQPLDSFAASFFLALGLFCISAGILYMLDQNMIVALCSLLGIGAVCLFHLYWKMNLLGAQILAILIAAGLGFSIAAYLLRRMSRSDTGRVRSLPLGRELYIVWPYFLYGCFYFLFLFSDRLLAWTAQVQSFGQFRGDYEIALDLALFAFIFQVGWVRSSTTSFNRYLQLEQRKHAIAAVEEFNRSLTRLYYRKVFSLIPVALVTTGIVCVGAHSLDLLTHPVLRKVTVIALMGFPFLVLSLWNVSLLFALSRPLCVLYAILPAYALDLALGYLLSRIFSYEDAVTGFAAGAILFAALSFYHVRKTFQRLDYYHFASAE